MQTKQTYGKKKHVTRHRCVQNHGPPNACLNFATSSMTSILERLPTVSPPYSTKDESVSLVILHPAGFLAFKNNVELSTLMFVKSDPVMVAPEKFALEASALVNIVPVRFAFVKFACVIVALDKLDRAKDESVRLASCRLEAIIDVFLNSQLVIIAFDKFVLSRLQSMKSESLIVHLKREHSVKSAFVAKISSSIAWFIDDPLRSELLKSVFMKCTDVM